MGDITKFMHKLCTAYSMYFNSKYNRTGALFEGKFKSEYADTDQYLKYLFSYIHLNPLKLIDTKWKEKKPLSTDEYDNFLKDYKFSSYLDYMGSTRPDRKIINPEDFPQYFPSKDIFRSEILDWITLA